MAETLSAAFEQTVSDDLISFLKMLPSYRMRRGIRFPQW